MRRWRVLKWRSDEGFRISDLEFGQWSRSARACALRRLTHPFAADPLGEVRVVLVAEGQIVHSSPLLDLGERAAVVDKAQLIGQIVGKAGQEDAVVGGNAAGGERVDVADDIGGA